MSYGHFDMQRVIGVWTNADEGGSRVVVFLDTGERVSLQCEHLDDAMTRTNTIRCEIEKDRRVLDAWREG